MTYLEQALKDEHAEIAGEGKQQKILYKAVDHTERYSDPEEQVRAEFWAELIYRYQYEPIRIGIEIVVPDRTSSDGSVGVYDRPMPANTNQAIAAVRLDSSRVLPDFARWFLSSPIGQAILDYLKRPVARANINLEEIGEIPILIPPLKIQHSIVEQVDHARLEMRRLRQEAETEWEAAKTRFERQLLGEETE